MKLINAIKFSNESGNFYIGNIGFEKPVVVRNVSVIKINNEYRALFPTVKRANGKTKTVIVWDNNEADALVTKAVEENRIVKTNPIQFPYGTLIGHTRIKISCSMQVVVRVAPDGTLKLYLPGMECVTHKDGDVFTEYLYFVHLDKDVCDKLAKKIVAEAEDYIPRKD